MNQLFERYTKFLLDEMIVAFGCTEPIALAYTAACASELLKAEPVSVVLRCSGNIIKNAKSVLVPNTQGSFGIEISAAMGVVIAKPELKLEILEEATDQHLRQAQELIRRGMIKVELAKGIAGLYIDVTIEDAKGNKAQAVVKNEHTNVILLKFNDQVLIDQGQITEKAEHIDFSFHQIWEFAKHCDLTPFKEILACEKEYNMAISDEGLKNNWGSSMGKLMSQCSDGSLTDRCVAAAAAGSDARMSGCSMPVVINSGSGNQGITVSVPVIVYAREKGFSEEQLDRALIFSNAIAEYQKQGIGRLSAYCGVVSAASSAVAAIAFLNGESEEVVANTLVNSLVVSSGMVCDGAKPSCAGKIAAALRTAFLGYQQAQMGCSFRAGDGLVMGDVDATIVSIGKIAKIGMAETDVEILQEMLNGEK